MSPPTPQIYRHDHILGLIDGELTPELYRLWGRALAEMLPIGASCLVTRDHRKNSAEFLEALVDGLTEFGVHVVDLGTTPYDLASYAVEEFDAAGFVGVGGGNRPADWSGLRWKIADTSFSYPEQVRRLCLAAERPASKTEDEPGRPKGSRVHREIVYDWVKWLQTVWYDAPVTPFRVIVDPMHGTGAGLARRALQAVFPQMVFEAIHDEPDEEFGGLIPDCRHPKSLLQIRAEVDLRRADLGIALDGDLGGFTIIDNQGVPMQTEEIAWFVLHNLLSVALNGEVFLHDVNCPDRIVAEGVKFGGIPIAVAHREEAFVRAMRRTGALVGLGSDGEIYFRGAQGNRIVLFAFCWFLDYFFRLGTPLAEWRSTIPPFYTTSELRTSLASLTEVTRRLSECWDVSPSPMIEGIRFTTPLGRVNVRTILDYSQLGFHFESTGRASLEQLVRSCAEAMEDLDRIGLFLYEQFQSEAASKFLARSSFVED